MYFVWLNSTVTLAQSWTWFPHKPIKWNEDDNSYGSTLSSNYDFVCCESTSSSGEKYTQSLQREKTFDPNLLSEWLCFVHYSSVHIQIFFVVFQDITFYVTKTYKM